MIENDFYTYRVTWSVDDHEYVGLCTEFPSLSWLASTQDEALQGIRQVVADSILDMKANNEEIPEPLSTKHFSGRFVVRVPPDLHRQLAMEASEAGISINRLATDRLCRNR